MRSANPGIVRLLILCAFAVASCAATTRARAAEPSRSPAGSLDSRSNYVACVNGESLRCDPSRLSAAERRLVEEAASQRNYVACANSWAAGCDPLRLTPDQKRIVDSAQAQREAQPCGSKWAIGCGEPANQPAPTRSAEPARSSAAPPASASPPPSYTYVPYWEDSGPRYSPTIAPWIVGGALAAAITWPLWTDSFHDHWSHAYYPYRSGWWGGYRYPYWGWNGHGYPARHVPGAVFGHPVYSAPPVSASRGPSGHPGTVFAGRGSGRTRH